MILQGAAASGPLIPAGRFDLPAAVADPWRIGAD